MRTASTGRVPLLLAALAAATTAKAGDRGLSLGFVDARGPVEDPRRDRLEATLFECRDRPLEVCRREHALNGPHDTLLNPVHGVPALSLDPALALAATRSVGGRRSLRARVGAVGGSLDAVLIYRPDARGVSLVAVNLNTGRITSLRLRADTDAPIEPAALARLRRFLRAGWTP
jgi:hypothetical protein